MTMQSGKLLRIFVDEEDRWHGQPLYTALVEVLRKNDFVGATVLKGVEGFGSHKTVHSARVFDFSTNLPILIEVIEDEAKIMALLPTIQEMMSEGLITLETVQLVRFTREKG